MLVAIEGIDGSGKGTQTSRIVRRLCDGGSPATAISFPMYDKSFFGGEIGKYLNGGFGELAQIHPKFAALLYAGDRFQAKAELNRLLGSGEIVICDRYTGSNQAHQGARMPRPERAEFVAWVETLEFEVFAIPRPDAVVLLDISPANASANVHQKAARSYTDRKADIHEADVSYLGAVRDAYLELAARENWLVVPCERDGRLRTLDEIAADIWERLGAMFRLVPKWPEFSPSAG
jgi:dTMP kinase